MPYYKPTLTEEEMKILIKMENVIGNQEYRLFCKEGDFADKKEGIRQEYDPTTGVRIIDFIEFIELIEKILHTKTED